MFAAIASVNKEHIELASPCAPTYKLDKHRPHVCAVSEQSYRFKWEQLGALEQFTEWRIESDSDAVDCLISDDVVTDAVDSKSSIIDNLFVLDDDESS